MSQVHADGCSLTQDGEDRCVVEKLGTESQRVIGGMSGAEHPLVATYAAHATAHLVGQRLEGERAIAGGEGAGYGGAGTALGLRGQEEIDGLFEAALEQVGISGEGNRRGRCGGGTQRNVEAVNGVQEKERAHAFVQVVAGAAEAIKRLALGDQLFERGGGARGIERAIAPLAICRNHLGEQAHWRFPPTAARDSRSARRSSIWESTCARSCPLRASANWATTRPQHAPRP